MAKDDDEKPKAPDRVPSIPLDDIVKNDPAQAERERREREARWNEKQKKDRKPSLERIKPRDHFRLATFELLKRVVHDLSFRLACLARVMDTSGHLIRLLKSLEARDVPRREPLIAGTAEPFDHVPEEPPEVACVDRLTAFCRCSV